MNSFFSRLNPVKLVALLLWIGVGILLAILMHRFTLGLIGDVLPEQASVSAGVTERSHSGLGRLFGATDMPAQRLSPDRLRVVGFMANASGGVVSVSLDNGAVRQLILGRPAPDGLLFEGVIDQQVVMSLGGDAVRIPLVRPATGLTVVNPGAAK